MKARKIGYARVSTDDQNLNAQIDFLNQVGCDHIYQEKISATSKERVELQKAMKSLRSGDTLIVLKLDRLGRSVKDLIMLADVIKSKGCHLRTSDGIDTGTPYGTFIFHIFSALAEMELGLIRERTKIGLASARLRGRIGGRPKGLSIENQQKASMVKTYYDSGMSINEICSEMDISRGTLFKYLKLAGGSVCRNVK
jgi:DNA invertase Pin-like site-specific DNA recombinase